MGNKSGDRSAPIQRRDVLRSIAGGSAATLGISSFGTAGANEIDPFPDELFDDSDGNSGGGDDCTAIVDPSGEYDHETISAALAAASPGDVICVLGGTYDEQLTVETDDVVLWGASQPENLVIRSSGTVVDVNATGFVMGKVTIEARNGTGVDAAEGTVVRNSRIVTEGTTGVAAADVDTLVLIGNEFVDEAPLPIDDPPAVDERVGMAVDGRRVRGGRNTKGEGFGFMRNTVEGYVHGVYLVDCFKVLFRQNVFRNNLYQGVRFETSPTGSAGYVFYDRNEFRDNFAGTILVEGGTWDQNDAEIDEVYAEGNVFDDHGYGVFSSVGFVEVETDDGETTTWIVPGPLSGEQAVLAPCNYWGHPTGPTRRDNPFSNRNFFTRQVAERGDRVTQGVDVRPWHSQPVDTEEELLCQGGRISGQM